MVTSGLLLINVPDECVETCIVVAIEVLLSLPSMRGGRNT